MGMTMKTLPLLVMTGVLVLVAAAATAQTRVTVKKMTVDGLEVHDLSCSLTKGGLFATAAVVGALAKKKKAFDACHPAGAAFAVEVAWGTSPTAKVTRASKKAKSACMVKALRATKGPAGSCTAVILVGASAAARKAAKTLSGDEGGRSPSGR